MFFWFLLQICVLPRATCLFGYVKNLLRIAQVCLRTTQQIIPTEGLELLRRFPTLYLGSTVIVRWTNKNVPVGFRTGPVLQRNLAVWVSTQDLHRITECQLILKGFQEDVVTHCARRVVPWARNSGSGHWGRTVVILFESWGVWIWFLLAFASFSCFSANGMLTCFYRSCPLRSVKMFGLLTNLKLQKSHNMHGSCPWRRSRNQFVKFSKGFLGLLKFLFFHKPSRDDLFFMGFHGFSICFLSKSTHLNQTICQVHCKVTANRQVEFFRHVSWSKKCREENLGIPLSSKVDINDIVYHVIHTMYFRNDIKSAANLDYRSNDMIS